MSMTICGYVTDDNGNGINGATVNLYTNGSTSPASSTTTVADGASQSGYWTFTNVADGLYYVKVTYQGHVRAIYGASCVQFNNLVIGANAYHVDSSGNATHNNVGTLADQSFLSSPIIALQGSYDSNAGVGSITQTFKKIQLQNIVTASGGSLTKYRLSVMDDGGTERWAVDNSGNVNATGTLTLTGGLIAPTAGPTSGQQHTLPAVTSDTFALLAATQTLTNKTLTTPTIASILNTGTLTLPTSTDTLVGRATTDTLTNKTESSPTLTGTVSGTPTWASSQAITLSTAAQPNVTSVGTLTSLTTSGNVIANGGGFAGDLWGSLPSGSTLFADDTEGTVGAGGALAIGAGNRAGAFGDVMWIIKGALTNNSTNAMGNLQFAARVNTTDTTLSELHVFSSNGNVTFKAGVGAGGAAAGGNAYTAPNLNAANGEGLAFSWTTYSSVAFKQNIQPLANVTPLIKKLKPVSYDHISKPGATNYGFAAEDVFTVLPAVVSLDDGGKPVGLRYNQFIPLLLQYCFELDNRLTKAGF